MALLQLGEPKLSSHWKDSVGICALFYTHFQPREVMIAHSFSQFLLV